MWTVSLELNKLLVKPIILLLYFLINMPTLELNVARKLIEEH